MNFQLSTRERWLALGTALLALLAIAGPAVPPPHFADFVDMRAWGGIPNAGDVLSNIGFFAAGAAGLVAMALLPPRAITNMERAMAALFFVGLVVTSMCSSWYHLDPQGSRLAFDRIGMSIAFAGLLGLITAGRVSERAGALAGIAVLAAAPWAVLAASTGNVLPWAVVQFGGMAALAVLACTKRSPGSLEVNWIAVLAIYAVAKLCEAADGAIFEASIHVVSGHSLKHVVAALAAWPVTSALGKAALRGQNGRLAVTFGRNPTR